MKRLDGRAVLITGAASGIGFATLLRCLTEGASVVAFDRDEVALAAIAEEVKDGDRLRTVVGDVTNAGDLEGAVDAARLFTGQIDGLVTAAGVSATGTGILDLTEDDWDRVQAVNLKGTWLALRAAARHMARDGGGVVVTVASQLAFGGGRMNAAYIASKGGIVSLTKTAAFELAPAGIRVMAVAPGAIDTPMLRRSFAAAENPQAAEAYSANRHALGRLGRSEEIAAGIAFLLSDDASFATGSTLMLEGGWTAA